MDLPQKKMEFSLNQVTTIAECDALLSIAQSEKNELTYRQTTLNYQMENKAEDSIEFSAELSAATTELESLTASLANMPEGPAKVDATKRKMRLELRVYTMNQRASSFGIVAVIDRQFEIAQVEERLSITNDFINQVEARKGQLAA
jgi:hypothetical protein